MMTSHNQTSVPEAELSATEHPAVWQRRLDGSLTDLETQQQRHVLIFREELQQLLVAARLYLRAGLENLSNHQPLPEFEKAAECITNALAETRALGAELRPPVLLAGGLRAALKSFGRETKRIYGIPVTVEFSPVLNDLERSTESCVLEVVRELVRTTLQCGHPTAVVIRALVTDEGHPRIQVQVDKAGIARNSEPYRFMLFVVAEHLQEVGGHLDMKSRPGQGICATIVLPPRKRTLIPAAS